MTNLLATVTIEPKQLSMSILSILLFILLYWYFEKIICLVQSQPPFILKFFLSFGEIFLNSSISKVDRNWERELKNWVKFSLPFKDYVYFLVTSILSNTSEGLPAIIGFKLLRLIFCGEKMLIGICWVLLLICTPYTYSWKWILCTSFLVSPILIYTLRRYIYIYIYIYKSIFPLELIDIGSLINGYQKNHFVLNETNMWDVH